MEDAVFARINQARISKLDKDWLVNLLYESNRAYQNLSSNQAMQLRAYAMASLGELGLPDSAIFHVLGELDNSSHAYTIAAAAIALRGAEQPRTQYAHYLLKAIRNIKFHDDTFTFDTHIASWPIQNPTSALAELAKTLQWMGAHARPILPYIEKETKDFDESIIPLFAVAIDTISSDSQIIDESCCLPLNTIHLRQTDKVIPASKVKLQDQSGQLLQFGQFFKQKITLLTFFYTRCSNPNKCTLTINKLSLLQRELESAGLENDVKIAAITYDPDFDIPEKLKMYGDSRSFSFNNNNRMFRVVEGFEHVLQSLSLDVNYFGSLINHHSIELFIIGPSGKIISQVSRLHWQDKALVSELKTMVKANKTLFSTHRAQQLARLFKNVLSVLLSIGIIFFPKCPMCWAAYMSILGIAGLQSIPYSPLLLPFLIGIMVLNFYSLYKNAATRNGFLPLFLSILGMASILLSLSLDFSGLNYFGLFFILCGSLLNSIPYHYFIKGRLVFEKYLN